MTLGQFKARLNGAKKGHSLLSKKRDALKARFGQLVREIVDAKREMAASMADVPLAHARATWAVGSLASVLQRPCSAALTVSAATENVAGVQLPLLNLAVDRRTTPFPHLGVRAFV